MRSIHKAYLITIPSLHLHFKTYQLVFVHMCCDDKNLHSCHTVTGVMNIYDRLLIKMSQAFLALPGI